MISIIGKRKIWFIFSSLLVLTGVISFFIYGLKLGIDFTGGSLLELEFAVTRPTVSEINAALSPLNLGPITVQPIGDKSVDLRFKTIDEKTHQDILNSIKTKFQPSGIVSGGAVQIEAKVFDEKRFESIGPTIGEQLKQKTAWALVLVNVMVISYIAWAFRRVSKPVASWKYGLIAVIALLHDIIVTVGAFVLLGKFYGIEANAPFVAALLTILGYSVMDTIVVFDRIRENLVRHLGEDFERIVDISINEVIVRSINTSFTVLLTLFAILLFGGPTIRDFVLALIVGITIGTYSSIFLASPLLVVWEKFRQKK